MNELKPYPKYKDSGVPWLGKVAEHWDVRQLGRIGRLSKGNGGTKEDETPSGVPCIRYGDIYTQHQFFIRQSRSYISKERASDYTPVQYGDILFAASGETIDEIGKSVVNLIESEVCCGGDIIIFRPSIELDGRFMGYAADCRQAAFQKSCMGRGITVMHLYADQLKYLWVALPPLPEQSAIVRFLDHADRRIARYILAKRRLISLLEEQKQAIIDRVVTRGLGGNPALKPSGIEWLGDIPDNYRRTKLRRLCISIRDGTHNPPPAEPGKHRLLSVRNIIGDRFVTRADDRTMSPAAFAQLQASYTVDEGDVVLALVGATTGKSAVVERMENTTVQRSIGVLRPKNTILDSHYLRYVIASQVVQAQIRRVMDKYAAQPGIYLNDVGNLQIIYPALDIQRELVHVIRQRTQELEALIAKCSQEISLLREFRTRLIADVVTGKLDVRRAAAKLPEEPVAPDVAEVLEGDEALEAVEAEVGA